MLKRIHNIKLLGPDGKQLQELLDCYTNAATTDIANKVDAHKTVYLEYTDGANGSKGCLKITREY